MRKKKLVLTQKLKGGIQKQWDKLDTTGGSLIKNTALNLPKYKEKEII